MEPSSDALIANDETTSQLRNNLLNENVNVTVCQLEHKSDSLYNNEIIKRVLKMKHNDAINLKQYTINYFKWGLNI